MLKAMYLFFFNFLAELEGLKPLQEFIKKKGTKVHSKKGENRGRS
jgi:hypothetical protein